MFIINPTFVINTTEEMLEKGAAMHEQVHGYTPDDPRYALAYLLSSMSPGEILDILQEEEAE